MTPDPSLEDTEPAAPVAVPDSDLEYYTWPPSRGGQHVTRTETRVLCVHKPTGIAAIGDVGRSQLRNKEAARELVLDLVRRWQTAKAWRGAR